ncbi:MAG: hypothetical protein KGL39_57060, partial [Patescibacteria group bacterium]|nr:hypothetical protein [Patescibacteria group bacterium]
MYLIRWLAFIIALTWCIGGNGLQSLSGKSIVWPALAVLGTTFLSARLAVTTGLAWNGSPWRLDGALTTLSYVIIFAAIAAHAHQEQIRRTLAWLVAGSVPVALYAVVQVVGLDPVRYSPPLARPFATFGNPDFLASYLVIVILCAVGLALSGTRLISRLLWLAAALLDAAVLALTGSRAGLLGVMVGVIVLGAVLLR